MDEPSPAALSVGSGDFGGPIDESFSAASHVVPCNSGGSLDESVSDVLRSDPTLLVLEPMLSVVLGSVAFLFPSLTLSPNAVANPSLLAPSLS